MQIPVNQIVNVEPGAFNGLTRTTFLSSASNNRPVYMFHKPENTPQVGQTLDGTISSDQRGNLKFTKAQAQFNNFTQPAQTTQQPANNFMNSSQPRTFKADPDKQESIEKQAYFKAAIDLFRAWKESNSQETLSVFASSIVKTALEVKRMMNDNAKGDIVAKAEEIDALTALGDIFGPGSQEVLQEGPDAL